MIMKTRRALLLATGIGLLILVQVGGWAQEKYVPKENEELFGRWKDDKNADLRLSMIPLVTRSTTEMQTTFC